MNKTSIEWTDYTWNPIHARRKNGGKNGNFCTRISPGCLHCYASKINQRWGNGLEYVVPNLPNVEFYLDEKELARPLKLKAPSKIFVGDMFDLFHEAIPVEMIAEVLRAAWKLKRHTFQFLTKRAARMQRLVSAAQKKWDVEFDETMWFGVSVEDQERHDERVPLLQATPCAVRFLSIEPQLEDIRLAVDAPEVGEISTLRGFDGCDPAIPGIDWVICGGESGPSARPFNLAWADSLHKQCAAAGVPFFCKQLGSNPQVHSCRQECCTHPDCGMERIKLKESHGRDMEEWPIVLRVRQFPATKLVAA